MNSNEIKDFLDAKVKLYLNADFINEDPISIPHQFSKKEDVEIAAFLTATIAWGRRPMIMKNARKMLDIMDNSPHDFILNAKQKSFKKVLIFVTELFRELILTPFYSP